MLNENYIRPTEWRKRISIALTGRKVSLATRRKLREINLGKFSGEKHWNWKGGITNDKEHKYRMSEKWRKEHPERIKYLRNRSETRKKEKLAGRKKPTNCEVCGSEKIIEFDHNHKTNKFRGWLCHKCNMVIGIVNDDTKILQLLVKYIEAEGKFLGKI